VLREEEQAAWQRIVRVLSHEINNSLTPIKSIAHSLKGIVERAPVFPRADEVQQALSLVEERSEALGRFLRAYAQLAQLPKPQPRPVRVANLATRLVELEKRMPVAVLSSPDVVIVADSEQLDQLLINVIRNAVNASLKTGGGVTMGWSLPRNRWFEILVEDEGKGISDTSNLFVPFFTTKPAAMRLLLTLERRSGSLPFVCRKERRGKRQRRHSAGHPRYARPQGVAVGADPRMGDYGTDGAVVGKRVAARAGHVVPGAVPPGTAGSHPVGMACDREQPTRAVLRADTTRAAAPEPGTR
jgi:two-component system nitrogen regulation sensor histidine kinase NtrY